MDGNSRLFETARPVSGQQESTANFLSYTVGLGLRDPATIGSFIVVANRSLRAPGIPVGLSVLAFAQIGVHLVFFLHLGSGPATRTTTYPGARFVGVLIVFLVITARAGSSPFLTTT